jgi:hypothetical protein
MSAPFWLKKVTPTGQAVLKSAFSEADRPRP